MNIHHVYGLVFRLVRPGRVRRLYRAFRITAQTRVLDVGGTRGYPWDLAAKMGYPVPQVTTVNLTIQSDIVADGLRLPFRSGSFDLVVSNSVIEHVSNHAEFAAEVQRVGRAWWVQTPDPRFPIEPHYLTPFVHWLPKSLRSAVLRNGTAYGLIARPSQQKCRELVAEIRLLPMREMRRLFPASRIVVERFGLMPKSIIAIGSSATGVMTADPALGRSGRVTVGSEGPC